MTGIALGTSTTDEQRRHYEDCLWESLGHPVKERQRMGVTLSMEGLHFNSVDDVPGHLLESSEVIYTKVQDCWLCDGGQIETYHIDGVCMSCGGSGKEVVSYGSGGSIVSWRPATENDLTQTPE